MGRIAQPFVLHQSSGRVGKADFHGGHKKENRIQYFQKFHFGLQKMEYYGILSRIVEWKQPETVKWRNKMADYKKMYAVLCGAIDQVIEPLERIPLAWPSAQVLRKALLRAEDIYVASTTYVQETEDPQVVELHADSGL